MQKKLKYLILSSITIIILVAFLFSPARTKAFDLNPVSALHRVTNTIVSRVSDIIYYLIMQKKYIFDNFTDPNTYPAINIPKVITDIPVSDTPAVKIATPEKVTNKVIVNNPAPVKPVIIPSAVVVKPEIISNPVIEPVFKYTYNNDTDILKYTNIEREAESLGSLTANSYLDKIADLRADDLFTNQYFEHESPDGQTATDIANDIGYGYLLIGENLALGNFDSEEAIVTAWMDSPGHRANIMNGKYTELGVAVKQGIYKGENTTIAVQIFGLPLSNCAKPNSASKTLIDEATISIKKMQTDASQMFDNLNIMKNNSGLDKAYYNQKISEYNYYAKKVNDAVLALKIMVDQYNLDIAKYNSCIK